MANVYLNYLDKVWTERCRQVGVLVRYADDLVILCRSEKDAEEALWRLDMLMGRLGLKLHPEKTRVVCLKEGREGFDFLGFHHRKVLSWRYRKYYLQRWPGRKAMNVLREKIRVIVGGRKRTDRSLGKVVDELNPILRGWGNYYGVGNSSKKFQQMDSYVREKLCLFLSKKHGKSGRGWDTRWQHINFRAEGLYQLSGTVRWRKTTVNALG